MAIATFSPVQPKSIRRQLTEHLREQILSGKIAPGSKLSSTAALAAEWNQPVATVHAAITPLVKAGLLVRQAGVGTVVLDHRRKLTAVGIYFLAEIVGGSSSEFINALHSHLSRLLQSEGIEPVFISDPRPNDERDQPFAPLVQMAEKGLIKGLVVTCVDYSQLSWLSKLPVSSSYITMTSVVKQRVITNLGQLADIGLTALHQAGASRIGIISGHEDNPVDPAGYPNEFFAFNEYISRTINQLGLETRESWWPPLNINEKHPRKYELAGYQAFKKLWSQDEKPDGLLVFTDMLARGVLMGILEAGVRIPQDLKLALHQNSGLETLCPIPAIFLMTDVQKIAEGLLTQVKHQFAGDDVQPIVVDYKVKYHQPDC